MCDHQGKCFGACGVQKSPAEINKTAGNAEKSQAHAAHLRSNNPSDEGKMHEHDMVQSRLGMKPREISMGVHGGGLVPANPFASLAQEGYLHAHPEKLGKKGLAEWDAETKGKSLPKHVK
jgi:hypothetical protein